MLKKRKKQFTFSGVSNKDKKCLNKLIYCKNNLELLLKSGERVYYPEKVRREVTNSIYIYVLQDLLNNINLIRIKIQILIYNLL